ncbi:hypothetical protein GBF38_001171 [Nibea albiflora]|uniref:Uncharacterized protein n=1 Tax=Nibea albiflora TaxID=240163 RepID=A0ACB7EU85_NIBAL|nr:hypothetical protein GBF38_001171 [Nibea albiflora]
MMSLHRSTREFSSSELNVLKVQLMAGRGDGSQVQRECDGLKGELVELQQLYDDSQRERVELEQELQRCKAELQKLVGRKSQPIISQVTSSSQPSSASLSPVTLSAQPVLGSA